MRILNKLERRFGRYAIENLMIVVCGGQAIASEGDSLTVRSIAISPFIEDSLL